VVQLELVAQLQRLLVVLECALRVDLVVAVVERLAQGLCDWFRVARKLWAVEVVEVDVDAVAGDGEGGCYAVARSAPNLGLLFSELGVTYAKIAPNASPGCVFITCLKLELRRLCHARLVSLAMARKIKRLIEGFGPCAPGWGGFPGGGLGGDVELWRHCSLFETTRSARCSCWRHLVVCIKIRGELRRGPCCPQNLRAPTDRRLEALERGMLHSGHTRPIGNRGRQITVYLEKLMKVTLVVGLSVLQALQKCPSL